MIPLGDQGTFYDQPYIILVPLGAIVVAKNWWWSVFLYHDATERKYNHRILWASAGLLVGPFVIPVYNAVNQRPATLLTSDPVGVVAGERLEKVGKKGRFILLGVFGLWFLFALLTLFKTDESILETLSGKNTLNNLILVVFPLIMFIYTLFSPSKSGKLNSLDRPLWGMKKTPDGYVDESLTKHKKLVVFLLVLCASPVIFFFLSVLYATLIRFL